MGATIFAREKKERKSGAVSSLSLAWPRLLLVKRENDNPMPPRDY
jgi:hypothetical protein